MSRSQWTGLVLWFGAVSSVAGQTSNVTQCVSSYQWSLNSLQQTPCNVAASLESLCGTPTSVNAIPVGTHYLGPTSAEADACRCSSVTYSMISACGGCQNRTFTDWSTWSANCATVSLATFPRTIPTNVVVPPWAYLDVTLTNNTFNASVAQQSLSSPLSSSAITTSTTSISTSVSTSPAVPSVFASTKKSQSNAGAIAGGVVGGLVLLALIALLVLWFFMRKRRNTIQKDVAFDSRALVSGPSAMSQTTGTMNGPSPVPLSQSLYTSDNSTFPGSPLTTSGVFTTIPPSRRSLDSVSPSVALLGGPQASAIGPAPHGFYAGAPEV